MCTVEIFLETLHLSAIYSEDGETKTSLIRNLKLSRSFSNEDDNVKENVIWKSAFAE